MHASITVTVGTRSGIIALHDAEAYTLSRGMQLGLGTTVSNTVSKKLQLDVFPEGSTA